MPSSPAGPAGRGVAALSVEYAQEPVDGMACGAPARVGVTRVGADRRVRTLLFGPVPTLQPVAPATAVQVTVIELEDAAVARPPGTAGDERLIAVVAGE